MRMPVNCLACQTATCIDKICNNMVYFLSAYLNRCIFLFLFSVMCLNCINQCLFLFHSYGMYVECVNVCALRKWMYVKWPDPFAMVWMHLLHILPRTFVDQQHFYWIINNRFLKRFHHMNTISPILYTYQNEKLEKMFRTQEPVQQSRPDVHHQHIIKSLCIPFNQFKQLFYLSFAHI